VPSSAMAERAEPGIHKMELRLAAYLLLGISTNIDNFGVGVAYRINRVRIGHWPNILIATFNAVATGSSMLAGAIIAEFLPEFLAKATGATIIALLGVYFLYESFNGLARRETQKSLGSVSTLKKVKNDAVKNVFDRDVSRKENIALAVGLSISNLTMGIGTGLSGFDVGLLVLIMFSFSWLMIVLGTRLGRVRLISLSGRWPSRVSGLLLIGLGVHTFFS
jgi:putative sporulation protein YtaF